MLTNKEKIDILQAKIQEKNAKIDYWNMRKSMLIDPNSQFIGGIGEEAIDIQISNINLMIDSLIKHKNNIIDTHQDDII